MAILAMEQAEQISVLLNTQNQLTRRYSPADVIRDQERYIVILSEENEVAACAELKPVQWYQFELLHLTVNPSFRRRGYAKTLIQEAITKSTSDGARILQSTIRVGNVASEMLFDASGFRQVSLFFNSSSGNVIGVWQKVLTPPL
jgi:L-amino acid N-acyltransferase YncA